MKEALFAQFKFVHSIGKVPAVNEDVTDDVDILRSQNLSIGDVGPELLNCKRV